MDSTSIIDSPASEKLPKVPSAASLDPAELQTQATLSCSQPEQQNVNQVDTQTRDSAQLDVAPDYAEAANAGAQADAKQDTKEDGPPPTDNIEDDVSIDSLDVLVERRMQPSSYWMGLDPSLARKYKDKGAKYARVAAIYTEGLENRVRALEIELLELQYKFGSKERPDKER